MCLACPRPAPGQASLASRQSVAVPSRVFPVADRARSLPRLALPRGRGSGVRVVAAEPRIGVVRASGQACWRGGRVWELLRVAVASADRSDSGAALLGQRSARCTPGAVFPGPGAAARSEEAVHVALEVGEAHEGGALVLREVGTDARGVSTRAGVEEHAELVVIDLVRVAADALQVLLRSWSARGTAALTTMSIVSSNSSLMISTSTSFEM